MTVANIPKTHRQYTVMGASNSFDSLQLKDGVETKTPEADEVLVRMHAVSLNNRDLQIANGTYPAPFETNIIPVSDGAGQVVAVGEGVQKWKNGDRVMGIFTQDLINGQLDDPSLFAGTLGGGCDGVLTEYRIFPAHALVRMPEGYSYEEAATLPCAAVTVYNAIFGGNQPLKPGATVVLQGTGGVSVFGAQLVVAAGANAIITSSSDDKLKRVSEHIKNSHNHGGAGRLYTINYKTTPDWDKEVLKITKDGRGADKVVEIGGAGTLQKSLACLRQGGEIDDIGYLAGGESGGVQAVLGGLLSKAATLRGILIGSRKHLEDLVDFLETGKIRPIIDRTFGFEEAKEAYTYMSKATLVGKVVIKV
ncbi:hypothetical protein JCM10296v2_000547 [Rhodotorula toruloides]